MIIAFDPSTPLPKPETGTEFAAIKPGPDRFPLSGLLAHYARVIMHHKQIATDAQSETI